MTAPPFLPLLYPVCRRVYNPQAVNDLGNQVEKWEDPVEIDVYGWGPPQLRGVERKEVMVGTERYVVEVELMVPPGVIARDGDRFQLGPLQDVIDNPAHYEWYRVVGPTEDYSHNPFGWNPGNVINLIAVKGETPLE